MPVPFVIYADFEAITKKLQGCRPNDDKSYTEAYQTHENCGYGYKVVCCYKDKYSKPIQTYRGENAICKFMKKMLEEVEYCKCIVKVQQTIENDELCFKLMDKYHILSKNILTKKYMLEIIVKKFRGSAHQECNPKLRIKPVIFHNL